MSLFLQIMTAFALQRRLQNSGITVSSLHPGLVRSEVYRGLAGDSKALLWLGKVISGETFLHLVAAVNCSMRNLSLQPRSAAQKMGQPMSSTVL